VIAGNVTVDWPCPLFVSRFLRNSSSRVSLVDAASHGRFGGVVEPVMLEDRSTSSLDEVREKELDTSVFTLAMSAPCESSLSELPSLFLVAEESTVPTEVCLVRFISSGTSRVPTAGAGVFLGDGDRVRGLLRDRVGRDKRLEAGVRLGVGMVQGNRRKIMHMKMMATLHTSVFLGS
jgi:hypothetical protein